MKPVCLPCRRFFRMRKAGFCFVEGMPRSGSLRPAPGLAEPDKWQPYKVWVGDRWECEGCGAVILTGFGFQPLAELYQDDFARVLERTGAGKFQINDC